MKNQFEIRFKDRHNREYTVFVYADCMYDAIEEIKSCFGESIESIEEVINATFIENSFYKIR